MRAIMNKALTDQRGLPENGREDLAIRPLVHVGHVDRAGERVPPRLPEPKR